MAGRHFVPKNGKIAIVKMPLVFPLETAVPGWAGAATSRHRGVRTIVRTPDSAIPSTARTQKKVFARLTIGKKKKLIFKDYSSKARKVGQSGVSVTALSRSGATVRIFGPRGAKHWRFSIKILTKSHTIF